MPEQGVTSDPLGIPVGATCLRCGYSLRDLTRYTCPECGETFDPDRPWTMWLPGAGQAGDMSSLRRVGWNYRRLKWLLAAIVAGSAWFVAPHPKPTLLLVLVWLVYALPYLRRRAARRRLFAQNPGLPADLQGVDEPDIRRLRVHFVVAFLIVASQLPFALAYAVSYPFLERTARYWWSEVPASQAPPQEWVVLGLLVGRWSADSGHLYVDFKTPTGTIVFRPSESSGELVGRWHAAW